MAEAFDEMDEIDAAALRRSSNYEPPYKKRVNKCGEKMQSYKAAANIIPETDYVSDNEDTLKDDIRSDPNFLSQSVSSATEGDTTIE
eukprot:CAMPEP_0170116962 /NCGR_PEP_ID=MMETSP0020_2-20130122/12651_1 /TAXON_ID=98059 /ORGANISM="Dinobryon sp., Strain UTEXLB2267" /LENGTH=86 /DNA_ID=CAMNT_0010345319 /DNA_START=150 /DNA_END=407 /DNA_ORIENTATION=-